MIKLDEYPVWGKSDEVTITMHRSEFESYADKSRVSLPSGEYWIESYTETVTHIKLYLKLIL